ncbi:MAG TPA: 50S ribosomal protein L11 methyltransferase [Gemmatimonadales bacterium]
MTAAWWRVTFTPPLDTVDAVAGAIVTATGAGVEEPAAGTLITVLESESEARDLIERIAEAFPGTGAACSTAPSIDWSTRWRDGIVTRHFGRLVVTPSWLPVELEGDEAVITIDPESAFGSGEHGSTRGALTLLERHLCRDDRVLDLGSGSGILAIGATVLGARSAIGIEIDELSIPIAEANAARNCGEAAVSFLTGDAAMLAELAGPAEVICSNILRTVNVTLLPAIARALAPGGTVIFAGMEEREAPLFEPVLGSHGFAIVDVAVDAAWWSVAVRRQ